MNSNSIEELPLEENIDEKFDEKEKYRLLEEENKKLKEKNEDLIGNQSQSLKIQNETLEAMLEKFKEKIKLNDDKIKTLEKEKSDLIKQASKYQSALGAATTYQLGDDDNNNSVRLNEDIVNLQDSLEDYVTSLRKTEIEVNLAKINNLLNKYKINAKENKSTFTLKSSNDASSYINDIPLIKAVLQRHVLQTIFGYFREHISSNKLFGRKDSLEVRFLNNAEELEKLAKELTETRDGDDITTKAVSVKIRQQSFAALGNRGFSNVIDKQENIEHEFIKESKKNLNKEMESCRKILDPIKKEEIEKKAADIICKVVRLFFFRLNTQEPIAKWKWLEDEKIDPNQMTGSWDDDDVEDAIVEICTFPLIYRNIDSSSSSKSQIYTRATVFIRDNYSLFSLNDKNPNNFLNLNNIFKKI